MPAQTASGRFLRLPEVRQLTGLGRSTIYRLIQAKRFPKQSKLSEQSAGWWSDDVDAWIAARRAKSAAP